MRRVFSLLRQVDCSTNTRVHVGLSGRRFTSSNITRTAIVTGSTSGIGLGIAKVLASRGCNIVLNGFGEAKAIASLESELKQTFGVEVYFNGANMSKKEELTSLIESTTKRFGRIDILVNNAGIQHTSSIENFPDEKWDDIISINLSAVFHLCKKVIPLMKQQQWGRIVNVSSVHGLVGSAHKGPYVASKHAVLGLSKVIALETAGSGITCNSVCPGWVLTPLVTKQIDDRAHQLKITTDEAAKQLLAEKQPSKMFVTPQQLGELVAFLCSDAAAQITGVAIPVDGGWTAQ